MCLPNTPHAEEQDVERFIDVQLLWDESMAERAAEWLRQRPGSRMVILAGTGHVMYGSGIPNRLKRRLDVPMSSIINGDPNMMSIDPDMGDYVMMTPAQPLPPSALMGVMLDTKESPPRITGVSPDSGAEQAGMEKDDQITHIGGNQINDYPDIRIALMDKVAGDSVKVKVRRDKLIGSEQIEFDVTLK